MFSRTRRSRLASILGGSILGPADHMSTTQAQRTEYSLVIDDKTRGHGVRTVSAALEEVPGLVICSVAVGSAKIAAPDGLTVTAALTSLGEAG